MTKKICTKCKVEKAASEFYLHPMGKDGLHSRCKSCEVERSVAYQKTKAGKEVNRFSKIKIAYGISRDEYLELLGEESLCKICKNELIVTKHIHVDHCHTNGVIRGILCNHCNRMLGAAKDNVQTLQNAIDYLNKHADLPTANSDDKNPSIDVKGNKNEQR